MGGDRRRSANQCQRHWERSLRRSARCRYQVAFCTFDLPGRRYAFWRLVMPSLHFETLWEYDAGAAGITIPVELSVGELNVKPDAKLDCGSTFCVFQREHGESLGFDIESGVRESI